MEQDTVEAMIILLLANLLTMVNLLNVLIVAAVVAGHITLAHLKLQVPGLREL
jgi:hypothetical protein